jgi:hypothetical protein
MIFSGFPFSCWRDEMSKKKHASMPPHITWGEALLLASAKGDKEEMDELVRRSGKDDEWKQEKLRDNNLLYVQNACDRGDIAVVKSLLLEAEQEDHDYFELMLDLVLDAAFNHDE